MDLIQILISGQLILYRLMSITVSILKHRTTVIKDLHFAFPGIINIENFTAAIAIALKCGVTEAEIRKAVLLFQGVKSRFDIRINQPGLTYIDDYAHHPEEIRACITSVKEYFRGQKNHRYFPAAPFFPYTRSC